MGAAAGGSSSSGQVIAPAPPSPPTKIAKPHPNTTPQELARAAAGRGIRHSLASAAAAAGASSAESEAAGQQGEPDSATRALQAASAFTLPVNASLSQLELNYRNSINELVENSLFADAEPTPLNEMMAPRYGFLSRDSSLIDLAMIPPVDDSDTPRTHSDGLCLNFDFPDPDPVDKKPAAVQSDQQPQQRGMEGQQPDGPC
jgi:hypothetical protein